MNNGPIYSGVDEILKYSRYLNLVELFKFVATKLTPTNASQAIKLRYLRTSVDIFIILKWIFILILIYTGANNPLATIITWYLLATNLYTYFYLHTWSSEALTDPYMDIDRIKRRFLNLLLAIFFTLLTFTYLYEFPYSSQFVWACGSSSFIHSFWYSVSNSLTASYNQVVPSSELGNSVSMIQLLIMFAFLTIIIGGSVPQTRHIEDRDGV
jgi:hypothetical protein